MSALGRNSFDAIVAGYDFDRFDRIVDVGGGTGALLTQILAVHPHPSGVVFDLPHVAQEATAEIDRAGLAHRCEFDGGSYLDGVPGGADLYVLKSVLMDCPDDQARSILRHVRQAMNGDGAVLVIESVIDAPNKGESAAFSDLNMLVTTGGRLRARDDWDALLTDTGFDLVEVKPTESRFSLIEGRPTARP
jgi:tRNA A58 N-methylase Trm61